MSLDEARETLESRRRLHPTPNRIECAWCRAVMRGGCEPVSHGICDRCKAEQLGQVQAKGDA